MSWKVGQEVDGWTPLEIGKKLIAFSGPKGVFTVEDKKEKIVFKTKVKDDALDYLEDNDSVKEAASPKKTKKVKTARKKMTPADKTKKYGRLVSTFRSISNPSRDPYEVREKDGNLTCNCPGFVNYKHCKHTQKILDRQDS